MNSKEYKIASRYLEKENEKWPVIPKEIPREDWPDYEQAKLIKVYRSRDYLIQIFQEKNEIIRLSVNRTSLNKDGRWSDNLSWDELQGIKCMLGYGDSFAVEIYPSEQDCVNVANMRHLWILRKAPSFAWMAGRAS